MVKIFGWIAVLSILLICIPHIYSLVVGTVLFAASSIGLLILLVKERIQDKKEEDADDFSQY